MECRQDLGPCGAGWIGSGPAIHLVSMSVFDLGLLGCLDDAPQELVNAIGFVACWLVESSQVYVQLVSPEAAVVLFIDVGWYGHSGGYE